MYFNDLSEIDEYDNSDDNVHSDSVEKRINDAFAEHSIRHQAEAFDKREAVGFY